MAEAHITHTLKDKAHDLQRLIMSYEESLEKARRELAVIVSAIAIFETEGGVPIEFVDGIGVRNLFKRGEVWTIARKALEGAPDGLSTRQLANTCLTEKGYNADDPALRRAMVADIIVIMRKRQRRREVVRQEERKGSVVWVLVPAA